MGPWARWEGPGWSWSLQLRGLSSGPGRAACSRAACLRAPGGAGPGSGSPASASRAQGSGRSLRFRDNCRVGRLGLTCSLARPVAATATATAERGVARFVCARRGGGGPGAPGTGGGRARAGRREGRERWGRGSEGSAPPRSHPCRFALMGCVRTWGRACQKAHTYPRARDLGVLRAASTAILPPANATNFPNPGQRCREVHLFNLGTHGGQRFLIGDKY